MRAASIPGKLIQLSNLALGQWPAFIQAWWQRRKSGTVPCVFPSSLQLIHVPLQEFYESYWFFSESKQGCAELGFFLRQLRPGDVLYDIGAFRGAYGAAAKSVLGDAVQVHAFEPVEENLHRLNTVAELNRFQGFTVVGKAVGSGAAIAGTVDGKDGMLRQGDAAGSGASVEFPSTSVDAYAAETGLPPSVMKIDIEGFEFDLLEGARQTLQERHPRLWVEVHPNFLAAQGKRWEDLIEILKAAGYSVTFFDDFHLPTRDLSFHIWCEP